MRLLVRLEDTPSVAFLVPRKNTTDEQLVGFHLALTMGYVDSPPFFCMSTHKIYDMANETVVDHRHAPSHPLNTLAATQDPNERGLDTHDNRKWMQYPTELRGNPLDQVDIYLDDFNSTCQGGSTEQQ